MTQTEFAAQLVETCLHPNWRRLPRPPMVLDVGCGDGRLVAELRARGMRVWGIDASPLNVAKAQLIAPDGSIGRITHDDAMQLPFPSGYSFNVVVTCHSLEHMTDPEGALREMRRVLLPSGAIVLLAPTGDHDDGIERNPNPEHISLRSRAGWRQLLEQSHFAVIDEGTDDTCGGCWMTARIKRRDRSDE